jgi:hypothetical protein
MTRHSSKKLHISEVTGRIDPESRILHVRQLVILCLMTLAAFFAVCFIYPVRKTRRATFFSWMRAEGWTLLMFIWFAYGMILLWRGLIQ